METTTHTQEIGGRTWTVEGVPLTKTKRRAAVLLKHAIIADRQIVRAVLTAGITDDTLRTGAVFSTCVRMLGITFKDFAAACQVAPETVTRWNKDVQAAPGAAWALLHMLALQDKPRGALQLFLDGAEGVGAPMTFEGSTAPQAG